MKRPNEINDGRGVRNSENTALDLEGRCSIHLSYGRSQRTLVAGRLVRKRGCHGRFRRRIENTLFSLNRGTGKSFLATGFYAKLQPS